MYKSAAIWLCIALTVCIMPSLALPDLRISSVSVDGDISIANVATGIGTFTPITPPHDEVFIPLSITVVNNGDATADDFNVGGVGRSTDPDTNAYGFIFEGRSGEPTMPDPRYGVIVHGLGAGASTTVRGNLRLWPQPLTDLTLRPGNNFDITAMVDYNLDPDAASYSWGIRESDERNNVMTASASLSRGKMASASRIMAGADNKQLKPKMGAEGMIQSDNKPIILKK
jgi:hypothetical protein